MSVASRSADPAVDDLGGFVEIVLQPDGRVFVHGLSRGVLELLARVCPHDPMLRGLFDRALEGETERNAGREERVRRQPI